MNLWARILRKPGVWENEGGSEEASGRNGH